MTPADVRRLLPALDTYTWLNAAASSPLPRPVADAMSRHLMETAEQGDLGYPAWARFRDQVREKVAAALGTRPGNVAFVPSTSFAFNVIASLLAARGVIEVITLESEFPSTTLPLLAAGLRLRVVKAGPDADYPVDSILRAVGPATGAIAVSQVQYSSGFRVDERAVGALCRERGLLFALNAAQALGQVRVDMTAAGAHFVAAPSHKWLMAGYGTGMLAIADEVLDGARLPLSGWLSVEPHEQFQPFVHARRTELGDGTFLVEGTRTRRDAAALEVGGGAFTGLHGVDAALDLLSAVGIEAVHRHVVGLQLGLRHRLRALGFTPTTRDDPSTLSGICVVPVAGPPQDVVRRLLREARIATTARGPGVRIATHVYNTVDDVQRLADALRTLDIRPA